jgi:hypothetical protein
MIKTLKPNDKKPQKPNKKTLKLNEMTSNLFKRCYDIFQSELFNSEGMINTDKIHEAFVKKEDAAPYCFGCSMSDSVLLVTNYLKTNRIMSIHEKSFESYFLLLNLLVDRMETMLDILNIDAHLRQKEFKVFQEIRDYINSIKFNLRRNGSNLKQKNTISKSYFPINVIDITSRFCVAINKFVAILCEK